MNETFQQARERYLLHEAGMMGRRPGMARVEPQIQPDEPPYDQGEEDYANQPIQQGPPSDTIPHPEHLEEPGGDNFVYEVHHGMGLVGAYKDQRRAEEAAAQRKGATVVPAEMNDIHQEFAQNHPEATDMGHDGMREADDMPMDQPSPMQEAMGKFVEGMKDEYSLQSQAKTAKEDGKKDAGVSDGADDGKPPMKPSEMGMEKMKKFAEGCQTATAPAVSKTMQEAKSDFVKSIQKHAKR